MNISFQIPFGLAASVLIVGLVLCFFLYFNLDKMAPLLGLKNVG